MYDWTIDGMLRAGFSKKMADYLHGLWKQEKESGLWAEEGKRSVGGRRFGMGTCKRLFGRERCSI